MAETIINVVLFSMLVLTALALVRMERLFTIVMLAGVFSLLAAMLFVTLDAVDVAFTEAAVGAGVSTVLYLGTIALTARGCKPSVRPSTVPLLVCIITGAVLIWGTLDMPNFGDAEAPAEVHVAQYYLTESVKEIDVPNVVTSILASYRGFDTLGEVAVIFAAGVGVLLIISRMPGQGRRKDKEDS
ncbi:MAG: DUF4040 domain-containing protein [Rhodobacteraceae bacterium]|nr:DUF4040 domain-containing protein [Paracoccaceae bacterium]